MQEIKNNISTPFSPHTQTHESSKCVESIVPIDTFSHHTQPHEGSMTKLQQFKTLVKKEFWTHKTNILLPVYIQAGLYVGIILICLISMIGGNMSLEMINNELMDANFGNLNTFFWFLGFTNVAILWLIFIIIYNGLTTSLVNDDFKHKCALFHTALPVSMMYKVAAKLFVLLAATILLYSGLVLVNVLVQIMVVKLILSNIDLSALFSYSFLGMFQGLIIFISSLLALFGLDWFFSAIFKEKTGTKTFSTIAVIIIFSSIIANFFGLVTQFKAFGSWLIRMFFPMFHINIGGSQLDYQTGRNIQILILQIWGMIFSGEMVARIILIVLLFAIGTIIIDRREIS